MVTGGGGSGGGVSGGGGLGGSGRDGGSRGGGGLGGGVLAAVAVAVVEVVAVAIAFTQATIRNGEKNRSNIVNFYICFKIKYPELLEYMYNCTFMLIAVSNSHPTEMKVLAEEKSGSCFACDGSRGTGEGK